MLGIGSQESLSIPACPFSTERLKALPGGMTRMGASIIEGKLGGHVAGPRSGGWLLCSGSIWELLKLMKLLLCLGLFTADFMKIEAQECVGSR